ncbi:hypothetical protein [Alkalicoccus daliensis]|uniref:DUF8042 domain-containing protein n=1 Tax=Alkalicoccus daliensis TaxID=745820 RepID=A0A1H0JNA4_9BACI|nr:hypothetical protein [Alkalicoccus daliensis]SDO45285.1 hypothetical protein SAMN04488053_11433 [Alkalicoccus daliensis]
MKGITEKQRIFLTQYAGLLQEIDDAAQYAGECYIQGDEDIADRLLASVSTGLIPYNPENMTLTSIFIEDKEAMDQLQHHYSAVLTATQLTEEFTSTKEKMQFLHETFIPALHQWHLTVQKYNPNGGNQYAPH